MIEIWKPIEGFEGYYDVSTKGNVRSYRNNQFFSKTPRLVKQTESFGYLYVKLQVTDKKNNIFISKRIRVNRLVAQAFIPNPYNKPEVDHIDRDRHNNNVENLRWVTHEENCNNDNHLKHWYKDPITNKRVWY